MSSYKNLFPRPALHIVLLVCFFLFTVLSWIIVFRDPRAIIGVGNLYPSIRPSLDAIQITLSQYGLNSLPTIAFAVVAFTAFVCYIKSLTTKISLRLTIIAAVLFQLVTFISYPVLSTDIFSYIFSERVSTEHHQNIWQVKPATFPDDQFGVLADWKDTTSVYGGAHYYLYIIPSLLGKNDLLTLVFLYKLVPLLFSLGSLCIMYLLLRNENKEWIEKGLRLVFWNPLFVLEIAGSAHNDSMMLFFVLGSVYLFKKQLWLLSGIVLALAVQVKLIPIVLFFFFLGYLFRKKAFLSSLIFVSGFVSINALSFSLMQVSLFSFLERVGYNGGVYWQSLQTISIAFFPWGTKVIILAFLLWFIGYIVWQWQRKVDPIHAYIVVILVYLLFVSAAYWNWYALWILPLVPFIKSIKLKLAVIILTFTSLMAYPLLWVIYRINNHSPLWTIVNYLFIFAPPILSYLALSIKAKWLKRNALFAEKAYNWV